VLAALLAFRDHQVHCLGFNKLDIGAGGVEMRNVGDDVAFFAHHAEKNALGGSTPVRGNDVPVAEDVPDKIAEVASAASVTLVAFDQGGPLMRRHGADSGIGQQVYEHILGVQQKQVVMRRAEEFLTLRTRGPTNEFDALDAEGLEYGLGRCMARFSLLRPAHRNRAQVSAMEITGTSYFGEPCCAGRAEKPCVLRIRARLDSCEKGRGLGGTAFSAAISTLILI